MLGRIAIQIHSLTDTKGEILLDVCLRKLAGGRREGCGVDQKQGNPLVDCYLRPEPLQRQGSQEETDGRWKDG